MSGYLGASRELLLFERALGWWWQPQEPERSRVTASAQLWVLAMRLPISSLQKARNPSSSRVNADWGGEGLGEQGGERKWVPKRRKKSELGRGKEGPGSHGGSVLSRKGLEVVLQSW